MRSQYTVLLANEPDYRRTILEDNLKEAGFEVISVETASDLVKRAKEADVLIADGRLDDGRAAGVEAIAKLVTEDLIASNVAIILHSIVHQDAPNFSHGLAALRDRNRDFTWLRWPFEVEKLLQILSEKLGE
jgi:DNA-binding NtrC family response regulator